MLSSRRNPVLNFNLMNLQRLFESTDNFVLFLAGLSELKDNFFEWNGSLEQKDNIISSIMMTLSTEEFLLILNKTRILGWEGSKKDIKNTWNNFLDQVRTATH